MSKSPPLSFEEIENQLYQQVIHYQSQEASHYDTQLHQFYEILNHWKLDYFSEFAMNLATSYRYLKPRELVLFKKKIQKMIQELPSNFKNNHWKDQLYSYLSRVYINLFQVLSISLQHQIELMEHQDQENMEHFLYQQHLDAISLSAYALHRKMKKNVEISPTLKEDFSRIFLSAWALDSMGLGNRLKQHGSQFHMSSVLQIKQSLAREDHWKTMNQVLKKRFDVYQHAKNRLLVTENEKTISLSFKNILQKYHIQKYVFTATLDSRTSDICRSLHGSIFSMQEYELGVTAPPMHPNCRSTIAPLYLDKDLMSQSKTLPYSLWKKKYFR